MDEYRKYRGKEFFDWLMGIPVVSGIIQMCLPDDSGSTIDCDKEREDAERSCRRVIWKAQNGKLKNGKKKLKSLAPGLNLEKCIKQMLPEECGGYPTKSTPKRKKKKYL